MRVVTWVSRRRARWSRSAPGYRPPRATRLGSGARYQTRYMPAGDRRDDDLADDDLVDYDPFSPETLADPFPGYAALRDRCPVHHTEFTPPFFTLSRYADVREALADP